MEWYILLIIYIGILFFFLFVGYWVPFALGTTGVIGLFFLSLSGGGFPFQTIGFVAWNTLNKFELTAIPLFIFMGEIILRGGISERFFNGASVLFRKLPGGLLQTNIITSGFFSAVSGSSTATAAAVGSVSVPELTRRGYNRSMIFGSLGGGGALGILIPPSVPLIIYGSMVQESVAKLFIAGIVPGILALLLFIVYIAVRSLLNPALVPHVEEQVSLKKIMIGIMDIIPVLLLILFIVGGIYSGITTPTESASLGVVLALVLCALYKKFTFENVKNAVIHAVRTSSMVMFIVIGAQILQYLIVHSGINRGLTNWIVSIDPSPTLFLLIIILVYLILGCLVDGLSIIFLTLPVLWPLIQAMGFDPIWFGVLLIVLIEIAQITPPVGMNLYVLQGIAGGNTSLSDVVKGNIPYFFLYLFIALLIIVFPQLVHWLPSQM